VSWLLCSIPGLFGPRYLDFVSLFFQGIRR